MILTDKNSQEPFEIASSQSGEAPAGNEELAVSSSRSPWTPLAGVKRVRLHPFQEPPQVHVEIPGSKSLTNRALVLAALADGDSTIHGLLKSDDSYWCMESLRALGIDIEIQETSATVKGCGGQWQVNGGEVFTGSSGTLSRFLPPALAAGHGEWTLRATPQMSRRPVKPLMDALTDLGCTVEYLGQEGFYPFRMVANGLTGGVALVPGDVSSQYLSGLLMATPYASESVEVRVIGGLVQPAYIQLTLNLMQQFGVSVTTLSGEERTFAGEGGATASAAEDAERTAGLASRSAGSEGGTPGFADKIVHAVYSVNPQRYRGQVVKLEADASTAGYFFALAAMTGGCIRVTNLDAGTVQPDIKLLGILERMGAVVRKGNGWTEVQGPAEAGAQRSAEERARKPAGAGAENSGSVAKLRGGFTVSLHELSDQALTVGVLAVFADAPIEVTDVGHIRSHESDRIAALAACLKQVGIRVDEHPDGFTVYPGRVQPGVIPTFDDHRVAMSMALLGTVVPGIELDDPGCVSKTCPDFFERLAQTGIGVELLHE